MAWIRPTSSESRRGRGTRGFNLVEADVRNIDFDEKWHGGGPTFAEIAKTVIGIKTWTWRAFDDVSGRQTSPCNSRWSSKRCTDPRDRGSSRWTEGWTGLSTIQVLRSHFAADQQPSSDPLSDLGETLARKIGGHVLQDALAVRGRHHLHPGGAPVGGGDWPFRACRTGRAALLGDGQVGRPMPSIAVRCSMRGSIAGVRRDFGPSVAYFLGGGVAPHLGGAFYEQEHPEALLFKSPVGRSRHPG